VKRLDYFIHSKKKGKAVLTLDTTSLMRARLTSKIKSIYKNADLVTADGIGIVWASKFLGQPLPERVTGIDMIHELCQLATSKNYRIFLLGGKKGIAQRAKLKLESEFSKLNVVGTHHGYFDQDREVIDKIRDTNPDILLVGMGFPKQEKWILKNAKKTGASIAMGVGGSFDILSGKLSRAPATFQKMGLEWFYRLLLEPKRLGRSSYIPLFIINILILKTLKHS
jgi:N-acetylglucosaminyldiphosphoundecaprenol N-acetyl-beta-D-mannosaminyltransferase